MASLDMDAQLEALDEALSPPYRFGRRWLEVEYEPNSLGRRRALSATVETRTLNENEDPSAEGRKRFRALNYGGLFRELRGTLGGRVLPR